MTERVITLREAVNEALRQEMERDPTVFLMGEDIAGGAGRAEQGIVDAWGGAFRTTKGLITRFGPDRVRDTPISEAGYIGAGIGSAVVGMRPVCELMFVDFVGVCLDQLMNQAAKMRYMYGGKVKVPFTLLTSTGAGVGSAAQHSQSLYALFAHIPGLKGVVPSDPYTAKGLLISAIRDDDPVVVFFHKRLYGRKGPVPEEPYTLPLDRARVVREGRDITLVGLGMTVWTCLEAADRLAEEDGLEAEVVDLVSISPIDYDTVLDSVRRTHRLLVVDEENPRCSIASEVCAAVADEGFDDLDAPPRKVTAPHTPVPYSRPLEQAYLPTPERVVQAVRDLLGQG